MAPSSDPESSTHEGQHIIRLTVHLHGTEEDDATDVELGRAPAEPTPEQPLWEYIRNSTESLTFERYERFMDELVSPRATRPSALCVAVALLALVIGLLIGLLVG